MNGRWIVAALLASSPAWSAASAQTQERPSLSFDEAIGLTAKLSGVQSVRQAAERHREISARISPFTGNPTLGLDPGYRSHPSADHGFEGAVVLDVPWNLGGLSSRRRDAARTEGDAFAEQARAVALDRKLEAARLWLALAGAERELHAVERARELAESVAAQTARRLELGEATALDVTRARGLVASARVEAVDVDGRREELALALSGLVSDRPLPTLSTTGSLPHPELPSTEAWSNEEWFNEAFFERVPAARLQLLRARAQKARVAEVKAETAGEIRIGLSARREAPDAFIGSVVASWTPALFDRGERVRASEEAQAMVAESDAALAVQDARTLVAMAFHEVEHTAHRLKLLSDEVVPNAREAVRLARELVNAGEETLTGLLIAQRDAMAAERALAVATTDHAWARVRLWLYLATVSAEDDAP